jgi:predicted dehydrogenase/nucleoside-diphosphate-sugar epimerase
VSSSGIEERRPTMLITGANGFIGGRLATLALGRGWRVRTLTRSDWATAPAVPVAQRYFGSFPDGIPAAAVEGADVVVHCAAWLGAGERGAEAVNVAGTERLASLARAASVSTFIFVSSQSARADAVSTYGRTKFAAEQRLLAGDDRMHVIILRPGLVTGGGRGGLFQRLCGFVDGAPVLPLLGGGRSLVQPIHVDDLCAAIFRCAERGAEFHRRVFHLGQPDGLPLADFLQLIARARTGKGKATVTIPLWPVEQAVRMAEMLRVPLPINTNNLRGMKTVERMETADDLRALGIALRPLAAMVSDAVVSEDVSSAKERAVRVLLIGAGRIGLVHAVVLTRLPGVVLAGIFDPNQRATGLLRGMGVTAPTFTRLEEALAATKPDAAVIATPPGTHLALARECLERGLALLIEKPLAVRAEQLAEYEALAQAFPDHPVQVGYVLARNPHVVACLEALRQGRFGKVQEFVGFTLLSLVQSPATDRWEVKQAMSGGGALINAGGHVLSMIHEAFGPPETVQAEVCKVHSAEVEDSAIVTFRYPEFAGTHYCSWSVDGYPRQENLLRVRTDRGELILTAGVGVFVSVSGVVDVTHQLDFDVPFNIAPDYAGAGFAAELAELRDAARTGEPAPMDLAHALRVERLLFDVYANAREVRTFAKASPVARRASTPITRAAGTPSPRPVRRVLDLRDVSAAAAGAYLADKSPTAWDEVALYAEQLRSIDTVTLRARRLRVTVPDFLTQSRLLSNKRYRDVIAGMGPAGVVVALRTALPVLPSERAATFWVAAMGLLGAALQAVPARFDGVLLLHGYLTDFALSLRRLDMLDRMLAACRKARPRARVGFHTNMGEEARAALWSLETRVDEVSVLSAPRARGMAPMLAALRRAAPGGEARITAEVGLAPAVVHRAAAAAPERWAWGADAVLIGSWGEPQVAGARRAEMEREWGKAFPGLTMPEGVV